MATIKGTKTISLAAQSITLLQLVSRHLQADEITLLWLSGDLKLQTSMVNGGVAEFVVGSYRQRHGALQFPIIAGRFSMLKHFSVQLLRQYQDYSQWRGGLETLPNLKSLSLRVFGLVKLLQRSSGGSSNVPLDKMFTRLESLDLMDADPRNSGSLITLDLPTSLMSYTNASSAIPSKSFTSLPNLTRLSTNYGKHVQRSLFAEFETSESETPSLKILEDVHQLPSLVELSLESKAFDCSDATANLLNLCGTLVSLSLTSIDLRKGFYAALPRQLETLHLQSTSAAYAKEHMDSLPRSLTSFTFVRAGIIFTTEDDNITTEQYVAALPRGLTMLNLLLPGLDQNYVETDSLAAAFPRTLTNALSVRWNLTTLSEGAMPPSLTLATIKDGNHFGDRELSVLPRSISEIFSTSLSSLTSASIALLSSFTRLTSIGIIPLEKFIVTSSQDSPSPSTESSDTAYLKKVHGTIVSLGRFLPKSLTDLTCEWNKAQTLFLDFGPHAALHSSLVRLVIRPGRSVTSLQHNTPMLFFSVPLDVTKIPALRELNLRHCVLDQASWHIICKAAPLRRLAVYHLQALEDEDLMVLPSTLIHLSVQCRRSEYSTITPYGLMKLPRNLETLWIQGSERSSWKRAQIKAVTVANSLPTRLMDMKVVLDGDELQREWDVTVLRASCAANKDKQ